jgi:hypothetical protein
MRVKMGVDLTSDSGAEFQFPNAAWFRLLSLAHAHGWDPEGELEDLDRYSADQAAQLAESLEKALGSGSDAEVAQRLSQQLTELLVTPSSSSMFPGHPITFEVRAVPYWREFIAFARRGGFSVS